MSSIKKTVIIAVATGLLSLAACQHDQDSIRFADFDLDGDGVISTAEASRDQKLVQNFAGADRNNDGVLDMDEFLATTGMPSTAAEPDPADPASGKTSRPDVNRATERQSEDKQGSEVG